MFQRIRRSLEHWNLHAQIVVREYKQRCIYGTRISESALAAPSYKSCVLVICTFMDKASERSFGTKLATPREDADVPDASVCIEQTVVGPGTSA